jgi:hypothetical protein
MGMTKEDQNEWNKPTVEKMDNLIKLLRESESAYWCKWCNRHIPREKDCDLFIHDDCFHPVDWIPECGGEHKIH